MALLLKMILTEDVLIYVLQILGVIKIQEYVLLIQLPNVQTILGEITLQIFANKFVPPHLVIMGTILPDYVSHLVLRLLLHGMDLEFVSMYVQLH